MQRTKLQMCARYIVQANTGPMILEDDVPVHPGYASPVAVLVPILCWQGSNTDLSDGLLGLSHCEAPNQPVERFQMGQKYRDQADPMRPGREKVSFSSGHCCPDSRPSDRTLEGLGMNASEPRANRTKPEPTQDQPETSPQPNWPSSGPDLPPAAKSRNGHVFQATSISTRGVRRTDGWAIG